jgi:hypothetical protein
MDISTLWKAQAYEQHSLISYSKLKMQTESTGVSSPWIKGLRHETDLLLSSSMNEWSYASTPIRTVLPL